MNIASAFENDYTGLESVSNWLKYNMCCNAFQLFQCIFQAFSTYLLLRVFTIRVTN